MDLTIAVISYNTRDLLLACLQSIQDATSELSYELVVVDNASADGSAAAVRQKFPLVMVVANEFNFGYAKACNQALAIAQGRQFLLLNSDTLHSRGTLGEMARHLEAHPDVGAVSCLQRDEKGRILQSCFPFPSIRDHVRYSPLMPTIVKRLVGTPPRMDCTITQDVDWANGACLMVRKQLLEDLGGLDESFFMYFEDVDLCRRINSRGYRVRHLADVEVVHLVGRSSAKSRDQLNLQWELSRIRYVEKHFSWAKRWVMKLWIAGGALVRLVKAVKGDQVNRRRQTRDILATLRRVWSVPGRASEAVVCASGQGG